MEKKSWILRTALPEPYLMINYFYRQAFVKEMHSHDFWQVILVTGGNLQLKTAEAVYEMGEGSVHILPPGYEHSLYSPGEYSQIGIDLRAESPERNLSGLLKQHFPEPVVFEAKQLTDYGEQICSRQNKGTMLSAARVIQLAEALILDCVELFEPKEVSFAEKLSAYLDENLHRQLHLQEIADRFYVSVPHLERLCRRSFHCGVIALLKQRRFQRAKQLLISTQLSVREIGEKVGYRDPAHFSGFFRSVSGMSPRDYRMLNRWYA